MKLDLRDDLLEQLPPYYREVQEYQQICAAEKAAFDGAAGSIRQTLDNFFIQTADEDTIAMWEKTLHITANPSVDTLDDRRERVLSRIAMQPPFTLTFLYRRLDKILGAGVWECTADAQHHTLTLRLSAKNQQHFTEVSALIQIIKPAHVVFISVPYFVTGLLVSEIVERVAFDYHYKLGSWALGTKPFGSISAPMTAKSRMPSVTGTLLSAVADKTQALVASALANSDVSTTELTGTVTPAVLSGSTLCGKDLRITARLPYTEPDSYTVTRYRLQSAAGTALFDAGCYFPVKSVTDVEVGCTVLEDADYAEAEDGSLLPVKPNAAAGTLQAALLEALAAYVAERIQKVRLNGSFETEVRVSRTGAVISVEYDVSLLYKLWKITQTALLDADGSILTQAAVDIPIKTFTTVTHTLTLKEGTLNGN